MSGGSFNYACFKAVDEHEVFAGLSDYRAIEAWLRTEGRHDAADEVLVYVLAVETAQRRLMVMGKRISPLLRAAEWTASCDSGIESVDYAFGALDATAPQQHPHGD